MAAAIQRQNVQDRNSDSNRDNSGDNDDNKEELRDTWP